MTQDIEVTFSPLHTGSTMVVVTIGAEVYGATDIEPVLALHAAARRAAVDLAARGHPLDPMLIVEKGMKQLPASFR